VASWKVVHAVGRTLASILERRRPAIGLDYEVQMATPVAFETLARRLTRPTITLFLYQVVENAESRNAPQREMPDGALARQPLALELCYLVTPWSALRTDSPSREIEQAAIRDETSLLGIVLQTFDEHAEVRHTDLWSDPADRPVWHPDDTMQLSMDTLAIEDLYRIWDASELPYRLSLTYRARVIGIDAAEAAPPIRVGDAELIAGEG